ncbi:MAG: hypothetical protein HC925_04095 [Coleofasciculaceae cyanobacterium SM2_3_26]|nr:hypothetical protein [Coleofasciculaceae cyanobacterium SM2_3_26]
MSDLGLLVVGLAPAGQALPPEVPVQAPDAIAPEALPKVTTSAPESAAIAPQLACRTPVETLHARSSQDCQPTTPSPSTTVPAASEPAIAAPGDLAATPEVLPPSPVPSPVPLPMPDPPEAIATPELPPLPPASRYLPLEREVPEILPEVSPENATLEYARLRSPQLDPIERPTNGAQLYRQRMTALAEGKLYTRLPIDSYASVWRQATYQPTYEDWKALLALEARAAARGQGSNQLAIFAGGFP